MSSAARTLKIATVARMTEEEARKAFQAIRWASTGGKPFCPECGCVDVYAYVSRPIFKCKGCRHQFSLTSGTIFADRKLPIRDHLLAIALWVNGAKGHNALQLSRDLGVQYRTAYVMVMKLREAIGAGNELETVKGTVEIDGMYAGGYVKPANWKEHRRDRRLSENQRGKRQVVVVMREREGKALPFVFRSEGESVPTIRKHVAPGSVIHADEAAHWESLHASYAMERINHSRVYRDGSACTNLAESWFSRLRRAEIGTHHKIAGPYLADYANEMAWRENNRRVANGDLYRMVVSAAASYPVSTKWCGYWQRHEK